MVPPPPLLPTTTKSAISIAFLLFGFESAFGALSAFRARSGSCARSGFGRGSSDDRWRTNQRRTNRRRTCRDGCAWRRRLRRHFRNYFFQLLYRLLRILWRVAVTHPPMFAELDQERVVEWGGRWIAHAHHGVKQVPAKLFDEVGRATWLAFGPDRIRHVLLVLE